MALPSFFRKHSFYSSRLIIVGPLIVLFKVSLACKEVPMHISSITRNLFLVGMTLLIFAILLVACVPQSGSPVNLIQGVSVVQPVPAINTPVSVAVNGLGRCEEMEFDWGDGTSFKISHAYFDKPFKQSHTYTDRGGGKTVTVRGLKGCEGRVVTRFDMEPSVYQLGFAQIYKPTSTPSVCKSVPNFPDLDVNNLVHITTIPVTGPYSFGIDFGCPFQGCRYDADGRPGSVADTRFPFPDLREFSLVLRVGDSQVIQGEPR